MSGLGFPQRGSTVTSARLAVCGVVDWVFRDCRTGRIVIVQWPNAALVVWLVASTTRALLGLGGGWGAALQLIEALTLG